jgi:hypothetical protein
MDRSNSIDRLSTALAGKTTRRQAFRLLGGGLVGGAAGGFALSAALRDAAAQPTTGGTAQIFDTAGNLLGTVSGLTATFDRATQTINIAGTFTDAAGNVTEFVTGLLQATGSCEILDLVLGPLDLNLLGLVVHLDRVHLNITAVPGPGNLLGNLLCAVAHLLDSNAAGNALANLLNRIFRLLG